MPLVPSTPRREDDIDTLRAELADLDDALRARAAELARPRTDLEAFRIRYRQEVGLLHEELVELLDEIARAELIEIARKLEPGSTPSRSRPRTREPRNYRINRST